MCILLDAAADAAVIFKERDYAVPLGDTLDLECRRMTHSSQDIPARVVWETMNESGSNVILLYDSDDPSTGPPSDYELVNLEDDNDDFTMRITMTEDTAIFTRCRVEASVLVDVSSTGMLFAVGKLI